MPAHRNFTILFALGLLVTLLTIMAGAQQAAPTAANDMPSHDSAPSPSVSTAPPGIVVSADWLQARLEAPSLVILHVGAERDYAEGHLPGAQLLTLADLSITGPTGLRLELPSVEALVETLKELGVSNAKQVVIYHGTPSVQSATRVWFTLDYLGLATNAALLDGGLALWKREGRPLSSNSPIPAKAAALAVAPRPQVVAQLSELRNAASMPPHRVLDARTPEFYSGSSPGLATRAGHIPGAISVPYPHFFDDDGRWRPPHELRQLLRVDANPAALLVTYCHIGQQATVPYVAARMLGLDVKMFDGSFEEWSRDASLPVDTEN